MKALFITLLLSLFASSAFALDCASNFEELKLVVGNADLPRTWIENGKDPLTLTIKNSQGKLLLNFKKEGQQWADVSGIICRKGQDFIAKVDTIQWGPASPSMVRGAKLKEIIFKMPYQSVLKVSVSFFSFEFQPMK